MISKNEEYALKKKQGCLVFDIETSSFDIEGKPINIKHDFNNYVAHAKVKWFGAYSYKDDEYYLFNAITEKEKITHLIARHETLVGFNNIQFDTPITKNNGLLVNYVTQLDVQTILGTNVKYGQKNRASYMRVKLKPVIINGKKYGANSLMSMAYHFGLETLKGDINYEMFYKDEWTQSEEEEIKKYLYQDVKITKELFDRAFDFYIVFADFLTLQDVDKWQWLKSSIASMTYSSACKVKECEVVFGERGDDDEMGGRAIVPPQEETFGAYDVDEASKYPHTFAEFNLCSEVDITNKDPVAVQKAIDEGKLFHGNEKFKVKGYYDIREQGVLEKDIIKKLKMRFAIKKVLKTYKKDSIRELEKVDDSISHIIPNNFLSDEVLKKLSGLEYALKILLNCFSPDTYVMTPDGAKNIQDFKVGDKCYSLNKETSEVEVATVIDVQNYPYDGEFIHIKNRNTDLMVTEEHNMLSRERRSTDMFFVKAKEFIQRRRDVPMHNKINQEGIKDKIFLIDYVKDYNDYIYSLYKHGKDLRTLKIELKKYDIEFIKRHGSHCDIKTDKETLRKLCYEGYEIKAKAKRDGKCTANDIFVNTNVFSQLLGWYIADGSCYESKFKQYETTKRGVSKKVSIAKYEFMPMRKTIIEQLSKLGLRKLQLMKTQISFSSDMYYEIFSQVGKSYDKHIPDFLWNVINRKLCYESMYQCDGTKSRVLGYYSTVSKKLVEQLKMIIFEYGNIFNLYKDKDNVYKVSN